jgi:uncharacterized membrane protein
VVSWVLLFAVVYALTRVLSGRAAFIHVGAMLGTIMVANVWMRIIPAQHDLIAAAAAGRTPDDTLSTRAKQRSTHNSYVTFPVIFTMLSNHYPGSYGHPLNWLVLSLLIVVGVAARQVMLARDKGKPADWWLLPAAAALAVAVFLTSPAWFGGATPGGDRVAFTAVSIVAWPEIMTTTASGRSRLILPSVSSPSMRSIQTSRKVRSGGSSATSRSASAPLPAALTR